MIHTHRRGRIKRNIDEPTDTTTADYTHTTTTTTAKMWWQLFFSLSSRAKIHALQVLRNTTLIFTEPKHACRTHISGWLCMPVRPFNPRAPQSVSLVFMLSFRKSNVAMEFEIFSVPAIWIRLRQHFGSVLGGVWVVCKTCRKWKFSKYENCLFFQSNFQRRPILVCPLLANATATYTMPVTTPSRLLCAARLFEKFINLSAFIPSLRIRSNYFGFILISIFLLLRHKAQHSCNFFFCSSKNMSSSLLRIVLVQPFSTASDNNDCHLLRANWNRWTHLRFRKAEPERAWEEWEDVRGEKNWSEFMVNKFSLRAHSIEVVYVFAASPYALQCRDDNIESTKRWVEANRMACVCL